MSQALDYLYETAAGKQWDQIGIKHHHGINVPLFSLNSKNSCGIGEYPDFIPLIDWCTSIGFDVIQTLPLNDTGIETSPYSSISAYALNPIHLGLSILPNIEKYPELQNKIQTLQSTSDTPRVDYSLVSKEKEQILNEYYTYEKDKLNTNSDYQHFLNEMPWLKTFALFKTLKVKNNWLSWLLWPTDLNNPTPKIFEELCHQYSDDIQFHSFIQFLCFKQMIEVKAHAEKKGVLFKGDIPILINRESADIWANRNFFNLELSAGAPPDMYNSEGQNWEFPIYNWSAMEEDDFKWWKERLRVAEKMYHIYRIDHVIGFFRIWAIPPGQSGKDGSFIPPNETLWIPQGKKILEMMLKESKMFPIAEDLGMVSSDIRTCMRELGICGTKVLRWERFWDQKDQPYIPFDQYIPESMTTVSTHDSDTVTLWWHNNPNESQEFANNNGWYFYDNISRESHQNYLWDSHHTTSLFHINLLQEYFALVPGLAWSDPQQDRINIPGVISDKNWTYRFKPSIEEFTQNTTLSAIMQELIK